MQGRQNRRIQGQGQQFNPFPQQQINPIQLLQQMIQGQQTMGQQINLSRNQRRQLHQLLTQLNGGGQQQYIPTQGFGGQVPFLDGFQGRQDGFQGPQAWTQGNVQGQGRGRRRNRRGRDVNVSGFGGYDDAFTRGNTQRGNFSGVGPRNYRRDDETITQDVCELLARHPAIDASDVEVNVRQGEVTLRGTVIDRNMKLLSERILDRVPGVVDIRNEIRVSRDERDTSTNYTAVNQATGTGRGNRNSEPVSHRTS